MCAQTDTCHDCRSAVCDRNPGCAIPRWPLINTELCECRRIPAPRLYAAALNMCKAGKWPVPRAFTRKSLQGTPIFTHPLHHAANATLFPAKSAQDPVESPVFL
jgi:hypothetical protein